jgi:hypothetical protein
VLDLIPKVSCTLLARVVRIGNALMVRHASRRSDPAPPAPPPPWAPPSSPQAKLWVQQYSPPPPSPPPLSPPAPPRVIACRAGWRSPHRIRVLALQRRPWNRQANGRPQERGH